MEAWTIMEIEATKERLHNQYDSKDDQTILFELEETHKETEKLDDDSPFLRNLIYKIDVLSKILQSRGYSLQDDDTYAKNTESKSVV